MSRGSQPTEEMFLKDVANHEMTVLMDNGVYRHLRFRQPKSYNMAFDILTYPEYLVYSGDMGCYVFSRLNDMFEFFRTRSDDWNFNRNGGLSINLGYWGEKLEAIDRSGRNGTYREFSEAIFRKHVEDHVKDWIEEFRGEFEADGEELSKSRQKFETELREAINDEIYPYIDDGPHEAFRVLNDFEFNYEERFSPKQNYRFSDTWEWDCDDYTFRFVWCCYALAWAIRKYDSNCVNELKEISA